MSLSEKAKAIADLLEFNKELAKTPKEFQKATEDLLRAVKQVLEVGVPETRAAVIAILALTYAVANSDDSTPQ